MRSIVVSTLMLIALTGCAQKAADGYQGYLEGEFIQVASPLAGRVEQIAVAKGDRVEAGVPLFTLERSAELAAQRQAAGQLAAARARLDDLRKGVRPSELAALEARLAQARSAAELSKLELDRRQPLFSSGATTASDYDQARLTHERNLGLNDELAAQLATGTFRMLAISPAASRFGRSRGSESSRSMNATGPGACAANVVLPTPPQPNRTTR